VDGTGKIRARNVEDDPQRRSTPRHHCSAVRERGTGPSFEYSSITRPDP
jgi:hypothetical protein